MFSNRKLAASQTPNAQLVRAEAQKKKTIEAEIELLTSDTYTIDPHTHSNLSRTEQGCHNAIRPYPLYVFLKEISYENRER
jgi:hypothetical protein